MASKQALLGRLAGDWPAVNGDVPLKSYLMGECDNVMAQPEFSFHSANLRGSVSAGSQIQTPMLRDETNRPFQEQALMHQ